MSNPKYELIKEGKLYSIRAIKEFYGVPISTIGGHIKSKNNLDACGNAWIGIGSLVDNNAQVFDDAIVCENAQVYGNAKIHGQSHVYGNARVHNFADVRDKAEVFGNSRVFNFAHVSEAARISGYAKVYDNSNIFGSAMVNGTAEIYGHARIHDYSYIFANAEVFGDAEVSGNAHIGINGCIEHTEDYICLGPMDDGDYLTFYKGKDKQIYVSKDYGLFNHFNNLLKVFLLSNESKTKKALWAIDTAIHFFEL